jgi:hypothetical protein
VIREPPLLRGQDELRGEAPEEVKEHGDDAGPPGLVARPKASAVLAVKVLVEQQQIAPVGIPDSPGFSGKILTY